jgi:Ni/Co efflux regulator RcnB
MRHISWRISLAMAIVFTGILVAGPALAEKPSWAGNDKGAKQKPKASHHQQTGKGRPDSGSSYGTRGPGDHGRQFFTDQHRVYLQGYFADDYRRGHCPPGLAKKNNGCMPPGQAKKWSVGRPLPRDVIFHDLPPQVLVELGPPPSHHRFVRVAQDILLIAVGTGMVVDAIEDLQWEFGR